jgi:hypothetical protein
MEKRPAAMLERLPLPGETTGIAVAPNTMR